MYACEETDITSARLPHIPYYFASLCRNLVRCYFLGIVIELEERSIERNRTDLCEGTAFTSYLETLLDDALHFLGQQTRYIRRTRAIDTLDARAERCPSD